MDIDLGESTFTNTIVAISRQPIISSHFSLNGSVIIQKAPITKKAFTVTLVKPSSGEVANIETEHNKNITLNFTHKSVDYSVRCVGSLDKSTDKYDITFNLQEV